MHRSRMWLALAVALGSLVATPSALAGDGARLAVSKLSSPPAGATADRAYELRGTVANRGRRTARGPVAVWLLRAGTHPRVAGTTSVSVTPQRSARYRVALRVPSGLSAGTYSVVACIKRRGRTGPLGCAAGEHGLGSAALPRSARPTRPRSPRPRSPAAAARREPARSRTSATTRTRTPARAATQACTLDSGSRRERRRGGATRDAARPFLEHNDWEGFAVDNARSLRRRFRNE